MSTKGRIYVHPFEGQGATCEKRVVNGVDKGRCGYPRTSIVHAVTR